MFYQVSLQNHSKNVFSIKFLNFFPSNLIFKSCLLLSNKCEKYDSFQETLIRSHQHGILWNMNLHEFCVLWQWSLRRCYMSTRCRDCCGVPCICCTLWISAASGIKVKHGECGHCTLTRVCPLSPFMFACLCTRYQNAAEVWIVQLDDIMVASLLFADDVVRLALSDRHL